MHLANSKWFSAPQIEAALRPYRVVVDDRLAKNIARYAELLLLWNQKINLTTITTPKDVLERHFGESMFAAAAVPIERGRLADVGSGAGFPGLALKLVVPSLDLTLIEPNVKKAAFLHEVVRCLALEDVSVKRSRAKDLPAKGHFDWVIARAVGAFEELLAFSERSLRTGGRVVLWVGMEDAEKLVQAPGWIWKPAVGIPQSRKRCLLVGQPA